ncbi:transcriptional coactivator HFI1/ADA1, partial [Lecanoromycetidae sp. Uapishka_2]
MPNIDPAALGFSDPVTTANPASLSLSKTNGVSAQPSLKAIKTVNTAQRIDLEPLYTSLKAAIGDNWGTYKEAFSQFALGLLNQNEFSFRVDHFITADSNTEHLHNQLVAGIYANVSRDPPEPGVAPWVSANDKPTVLSKPVSGDAAEQRLKTEVMQLPARDRRRIKEAPVSDVSITITEGDYFDTVLQSHPRSMNDYHEAKRIKLPDSVPASADWELEIRKRYSQPLASETGEFPDADSIQNRMLPICYEETVPNGPSASCADFMATATEQFVKTVVGDVLGKTRSNLSGAAGAISIMTRRYRQQLLQEEQMLSRGEVSRGIVSNRLPVETKEAGARKSLGLGDFRVALGVGGDCGLGQMPTIVKGIMGSYPEGVLEGYGRHHEPMERVEEKEFDRTGARTNGVLTNGTHVNGILANDNENYGWEGGGAKDRERLNSLLDDCLAFGQ